MLRGFLLLFLALDMSAATIGGRVLDDLRRTPVAGMEMLLYDEAGRPIRNTATAVDGTYSFEIPAGSYYVSTNDFFGTSGYTNEVWDNVSCERPACDPLRGTRITVAANEQRTFINFLLRTLGAPITGTVVDALTAAPVAGARVEAIHLPSERVTAATTDATGRYTIPPLDPGGYAIKVSAPGYAVTLHGFGTCPEPCRPAAASVQIGEHSFPSIDFALEPLARVTVTFVDAITGAVIPEAQLHAGRPSGRVDEWMDLTTATAGRASVDLYPGVYRFRAQASGYQPLVYPDLPCANCPPATAEPIVLASGNRRELTFRLYPRGRITGRVLSSDGTPLRDASVQFGTFTNTGADGRFDFAPSTQQPFTAEVVVTHPEYVPVSLGRRTITPGHVIDAGEVVLQPRGGFFGSVTSPDGPVPNTRIGVSGPGVPQFYSVPVAPDGTFRVERLLLDGDYFFSVGPTANAPAVPWSFEQYEDVGCGMSCGGTGFRGTPVRGRPGETIGPIDFHLELPGTLRVTRRARNARVQLGERTLFLADRYGQLFSAGRLLQNGVSDVRLSRGTYYLAAEQLAPNVYRTRPCEFSCDVGALQSRIDIRPGETIEITLEETNEDLVEIETIHPQAGPTSGGNTVTIRGGYFNRGDTVTIGGVPAIIRHYAYFELVVEVPPRMAEEVVDVVVQTPHGDSDAILYRYTDSCTAIVAESFQRTPIAGTGELRVAAAGSGPIRYEWFLGSPPSMRYPAGTSDRVTTVGGTAFWVRLTNPCSSATVRVFAQAAKPRSAGR